MDKIKTEWDIYPELHREFDSYDVYRRFRLAEIGGLIPVTLKPGPLTKEESKTFTDKDFETIWKHNASIQAEFDSPEIFAAYQRASLKGLVKE